MYEWLQPYLNWRWQIRESFHTSNQVTRAVQEEKEILLTFNKRLINDANAMTRTKDMGVGRRIFEIVKDRTFTRGRKDLITNLFLEPEAQSVLALAKKSKATLPSFAILFDNYVHDSLAGFNLHHLELSGYWRYRKVFLDSDDHLIAINESVAGADSIA
ncbi:hypothetical protein [Massilia sp. YIM B02443]|nr:hypothetical protein [Massilia sp. YIM B02443]MDN4036297.1 hypothetical protein [Massilia sp. YIM B02443]